MLYMLISMWLATLLVPFVAWDAFMQAKFFSADFPGSLARVLDAGADLLVCVACAMGVFLFHRRHPMFLPLVIALLTFTLLQRLLGYWLLPASSASWISGPPPGLPYVRALGVMFHLLLIGFALRSETLRQQLAIAAQPNA